MIGKNKSYKSQFVTKNLMVIVCMLILCLAIQLPVDAVSKKKVTMDQTDGGTLYPKILAAWIAYKLPTGWVGPPYPKDNTPISIKLVIKAWYQGTAHLYFNLANENSSNWYLVGVDGDRKAVPTTYPTVSSVVTGITTIENWDTTNWGDPTVTWYACGQRCYDYQSPYSRKYDYQEGDISGLFSHWGLDGFSFGEGLFRLRADLEYKSNRVSTLKKELATRIGIRSSRNFGITNIMRREYVQWLFAYLREPYEYGGKSFGGKTTSTWDKDGTETGYGIDCSGLVVNGAKWAGYNWPNTTSGTGGIVDVSSITFPNIDPFGPGDILDKVRTATDSDAHVVTVIGYNSLDGTVDIIEAVGSPASTVRVVDGQRLREDYIYNRFVKRRLIASP